MHTTTTTTRQQHHQQPQQQPTLRCIYSRSGELITSLAQFKSGDKYVCCAAPCSKLPLLSFQASPLYGKMAVFEAGSNTKTIFVILSGIRFVLLVSSLCLLCVFFVSSLCLLLCFICSFVCFFSFCVFWKKKFASKSQIFCPIKVNFLK